MNKTTPFRLLLPLLLLSLATAALAYSSAWRLQFSGEAENSGTIAVQLSTSGENPMVVPVDIEQGRSAEGVARDVVMELNSEVGNDYSVTTSGGGGVLIRRERDQELFDVMISENTVRGIRISESRE